MIAVLTGDLVNSTKMTSATYEKVIENLRAFLDNANIKFNANGEIYRGDGFQIQYPNPFDALKNTLLLKLSLHLSTCSSKPTQCTLSLAYGEHEIYAAKPNTSSGPVFINSGRGLDITQKGDISLHLKQLHKNNEVQLLTQFLNHLLNKLTRSQTELLYKYIDNDFIEHKKIADITGTTRQNISNRLSKMGAFLVRDYMETINQIVKELKDNS